LKGWVDAVKYRPKKEAQTEDLGPVVCKEGGLSKDNNVDDEGTTKGM
jgi:hypothetical protein